MEDETIVEAEIVEEPQVETVEELPEDVKPEVELPKVVEEAVEEAETVEAE